MTNLRICDLGMILIDKVLDCWTDEQELNDLVRLSNIGCSIDRFCEVGLLYSMVEQNRYSFRATRFGLIQWERLYRPDWSHFVEIEIRTDKFSMDKELSEVVLFLNDDARRDRLLKKCVTLECNFFVAPRIRFRLPRRYSWKVGYSPAIVLLVESAALDFLRDWLVKECLEDFKLFKPKINRRPGKNLLFLFE